MTEELLMASMLQSVKQHLDLTRKDLYALTQKLCYECAGTADNIANCTQEDCVLHKHRIKAELFRIHNENSK